MKRVVVNADDFGISNGTNKGIEKAYREGILTSTSIMPTGPAFMQAVSIAKKNKNLGIGVHISLTWGKSVLPSEEIPALVDNDGYFHPSFFSLLIRPLRCSGVLKQVEAELQAQIEMVKNSGISIDHLNSQVHIHLIPWIFPIFVRMANRYKVKFIRVPLEPFSLTFSIGLLKWLILQALGLFIFLQGNLPKKFPIFYGVLYTSQMYKNVIKKILKRKDKGIVEILSHPGYYDPGTVDFNFKKQGVGDFIKNKNRKKELDTLLDKELNFFIAKNNIQLINFSGKQKSD